MYADEQRRPSEEAHCMQNIWSKISARGSVSCLISRPSSTMSHLARG